MRHFRFGIVGRVIDRFGIAKELAVLLMLFAGSIFLMSAQAGAQSLEDQIGSALQSKKPLTRSMTVDPKAEAEKQIVNKLRTRAISIEAASPPTGEERAQIAAIARDKPAIDLEILFDYDSAVVGPKAAPSVNALGAALSKDQFRNTVFFINGHTDAQGSPEYNQTLSQRRADAVRRVLIERFRMTPDTLVATGFGKEQLKNAANPLADENRRVQIVNTTVTGR